jgi:hypothetical protein
LLMMRVAWRRAGLGSQLSSGDYHEHVHEAP